MAGFYVLQWNARSLLSNHNELKKYIYDLKVKPSVICIQETYLKPKYSFSIAGYDCIRNDRLNKQGGGVAIFIKKNIPYVTIQINPVDKFEIIQIKVFVNQTFLNIVNMYNLPESNLHYNDIYNVLNQRNLIFCSDINSYNKLWGSKTNNKNGLVIEEVISDLNIAVLNDGTGTHLNPSGELSHLDVTFSSANLAVKSNWQA
jgi:exonuclease III